jgi:hypothetical protein
MVTVDMAEEASQRGRPIWVLAEVIDYFLSNYGLLYVTKILAHFECMEILLKG